MLTYYCQYANLISQYHESPDGDYCVALVVVVVVVIIVVLRGIDSQCQLADFYPLPYYSNTLQFDHTLYSKGLPVYE